MPTPLQSTPSPTWRRQRAPRSLAGAIGLLGVLGGCGGEAAPTPAASPTEVAPRTLPALPGPAAWSGTLPCADCGGIVTALTLSPDGLYRRTERHLGGRAGESRVSGAIGRWMFDSAGGRVLLAVGAGHPWAYTVAADGALVQRDLAGAPIESSLDYRLRPLAEPPDVNSPMDLTGAFTYLADAARWVTCGGALSLPVSMEGGYRALEGAYLVGPGEAGAPRIMRVRAHVAERTRMEGDGTEPVLVVDEFIEAVGGTACDAITLAADLAAGEWIVTHLDGEAIATTDEAARPTLTFTLAPQRLGGSAGCNRYMGSATLRGGRLVAPALATTKRLCADGSVMARERRLLALLGGQPFVVFTGDTVRLADGVREAARLVRR